MIVLDTHALIWWVSDPSRLSSSARKTVSAHADRDQVLISSISTWEIALLTKRSRLKLSIGTDYWIAHVEALDHIRFVPVDNRIALRSASLPEPFHKDPADRMIVATAQQLRAQVVTADEKIRNYPYVETIW